MIAKARELAPEIDWREGNAMQLPFADASFDLVLCQQMLQFVPDPAVAVREIHRVLAPNGRVIASTWRPRDEQPLFEALGQIADALGVRREFDPATARQTFRLAMADLPAQVLARPLIADILRDAPGVDLRLRSFHDRRDAIVLLDDARVDAAIGVSPGQEARILHQPLFEQAFVGIAAADADSVDRFTDLDGFCSAGHLLVSPEGDDFGAVDAALETLGRSRRIVASVAAMHLAPEIVANTDLVAALPANMVAGSPFRERLTVFKLPVSVDPVTFHLLWHRRSHDHPAQRWFREAIVLAASMI